MRETNEPSVNDQNTPINSRQVLAAILLVVLIAAMVVSVAYFIASVIIPGIAAGFAQFGLLGNYSHPGPLYR